MHDNIYFSNLGVNNILVLYLANFNSKRINLSKSASFNWEGMSVTQFILAIPLVLTPYLIYWPFYLLKSANAGIGTIAVIGVTCILTREFWLKMLVNKFHAERYKIAEGFRKE
jgi:hypothetical protein